MRSAWTVLSDMELLEQCRVDTYRASGPGGQKRNKTSSAVRLCHLPSGLLLIAEESRSQHENKARALRRLRQRLHLRLREPFAPETAAAVVKPHGLKLGIRDERFWPVVGFVLDGLEATEGRVGETAEVLGVSTGRLIDFLRLDVKVWEEANHIRQRFGHKPLKDS
jgi:hypothetical protein